MTNRRSIRLTLLLIGLILVAGLFWFIRLRSPASTLVFVGGLPTGDNLDIKSSTLVVVPPEPGVLFGTVKKPGTHVQFTYIILFKYGRQLTGHSTRLMSKAHVPLAQLSETSAETVDAYEVNGGPIEASYRVEFDATQTVILSERMTIGGKHVDMTAGQVFLIDLTTASPVYQQREVELPAIPSKLETREDAERAAEAIRSSLDRRDPKIKAFLR